MANKDIIKQIIESSLNVRVAHYIIIPLDGPLTSKPGIIFMFNFLLRRG